MERVKPKEPAVAAQKRRVIRRWRGNGRRDEISMNGVRIPTKICRVTRLGWIMIDSPVASIELVVDLVNWDGR